MSLRRCVRQSKWIGWLILRSFTDQSPRGAHDVGTNRWRHRYCGFIDTNTDRGGGEHSKMLFIKFDSFPKAYNCRWLCLSSSLEGGEYSSVPVLGCWHRRQITWSGRLWAVLVLSWRQTSTGCHRDFSEKQLRSHKDPDLIISKSYMRGHSLSSLPRHSSHTLSHWCVGCQQDIGDWLHPWATTPVWWPDWTWQKYQLISCTHTHA